MEKTLKLLTLVVALMLGCIGCSSDDADDNNGTVEYLGVWIPYEPLQEKDMPEWLVNLMNDKANKTGLYRICVGKVNGEVVYNLNTVWDDALVGWFYDKDGNRVNFAYDEFLSQIRNFKCIYYRELQEILNS